VNRRDLSSPLEEEASSINHRHSFGVTSVAVSPDGSYVASGGADKAVRLLELREGDYSRLGDESGREQEEQDQHP